MKVVLLHTNAELEKSGVNKHPLLNACDGPFTDFHMQIGETLIVQND